MITSLKKIITLSLLLPGVVFAASSQTNEDCAIKRHYLSDLSGISKMLCSRAIDRYKEGKQTAKNVDMICGSTENVAWRKDQDNSMSDSNEKPARAMAMIIGRSGNSAAVQVCPGVYLATAHGALDNPNEAREENRELVDPAKNIGTISAFPLSKDNIMKVSQKIGVISPRIKDPSSWNDLGGQGKRETDYAFITVEKSIRPNDFITPLNYEQNELQNASSGNELDVNLYRPKTRYALDSTGNPVEAVNERGNTVFDDSTLAEGKELLETYKTPQKVNRRCDILPTGNEGVLPNNCPSEIGVSGSTFATKIGNDHYLLGLHVSSVGNINIPKNDISKSSGQFIMTKQFCDDFKTACGKPCPTLSDTLSQQSDVSL